MLLPGLVCLLLMPLVIRVLCPPELKATPNAIEYARVSLLAWAPWVAKSAS
jgi:DASS family divalent anion:Na+ symporter